MRIFNLRSLREYGKKYGPRADSALRAWFHEANEAEWKNSQEIRKRYNNAKIIDDEVVVFKICHNDYRLVVKVWYSGQQVYIKFFGTHAEYDRFDVKGL
jgi:mRNA interferase HigB